MECSYEVSIVIPVYNTEKYLNKCLQSLFSQSMNSSFYEIILINDGSTDNSGVICKSWAEKYNNIVYHQKKNSGVSDTRNLGIKMAKGKYILFLDPDDYLSKNALADITSFFDKHYDEIDMVTYPAILFYPNGRKKMHSRYQKDFGMNNKVFDLNESYYLVQATINVCIKNDKSVFFATDQSYSEDERFNTEILMKKQKLGYVSNAYYYYRQHSSSVTAKKKNYDFEKIYKFYDGLLEKYHNHPYIQSIVINNLRWRIEEDCLYPEDLSLPAKNQYLQNLEKRLKKIDFSLFCNRFPNKIILEMIALSRQTGKTKINQDGNCSLYIDNNKIFNDLVSTNELSYLTIKDNSLMIEGKLQSCLFYDRKVEFYAVIHRKNNLTEKVQLELKQDLEYKKFISRNYYLKLDLDNIEKIDFEFWVNRVQLPLRVENVEWCATHKVIDCYQISIMTSIFIERKKIYHSFMNKFSRIKSLKFLVINILSLFFPYGKGANLYFGDRDSALFKEYIKDSHKKIFCESGNGIKYKIQILNCKCVITDKKVSTVLPFGKMRKNYIEASKFKVVKK